MIPHMYMPIYVHFDVEIVVLNIPSSKGVERDQLSSPPY